MINLIQNGKANSQIVIAADPAPVEKHAAEELQRFIEKISGARLSIVNTPVKDRPNIYIGAAVPTQGVDLSESILGFDGYIVKTIGRDIVLAGAKPYSCLYAVYHLLERYLGCGFFEDGDQVPRHDTVEVGKINDVKNPRFEQRIFFGCMQDTQSGMRWWDWEEFKPWVEWMAKKRFNIWYTERNADSCGIVALAATKLGVPIELTPWQQKRIKLLRRVFDYARLMGIRTLDSPGPIVYVNHKAAGDYAYMDARQTGEFVRRYSEMTGEIIPAISYVWCGITYFYMDPRHPVTKKFIAAIVESYTEALGTDHLYLTGFPSEGGWAGDDIAEMNKVTYSMAFDLVEGIKMGDPSAIISTRAPFPYNKTFEAQKQAVRDARLPIIGDFFLNQPGRLHDFMMCDYYWGLPWSTGMTVMCGPETTPWGDFKLCICNAQELAVDPRAHKCNGFMVSNEMNHRCMMKMDLFTELAWNPADVELENYLHRWTVRRYGAEAADCLHPATEAIASTLYSNDNTGIKNGALYRFWQGGYLPGLTSVSVKRALSYLPELRFALEVLFSGHNTLKKSSIYRFDIVDLGRTYLSAIFNYQLAKARKALRVQDKVVFEQYAQGVEELMHFIARYVSTDPQFRLKTYDDWASRWPELMPGYDNTIHNFFTFTIRTGEPEARGMLFDYAPEDFAELVEHFYLPRVKLYLQKMRELLAAGKDISGRLVYRGSDTDMPYSVSDWATPRGKLPWSPYGATCEPELTAKDQELAYQIIEGGTVSGKFNFYEGPIDVLVRELLDRFPVPHDLMEILAEQDSEVQALQASVLEGKPGDEIMGFRTPDVVEQVNVPGELNMLVTVEKLSESYNIMRGDIASYKVHVSDYLKLKRLPDEKASSDGHSVAVFAFEARDRKYILRYDPGSDAMPAKLLIVPLQ